MTYVKREEPYIYIYIYTDEEREEPYMYIYIY